MGQMHRHGGRRESPFGAILSTIVIIVLLVWVIGLYWWCMEQEPIPLWLFVILEAVPVCCIIGLLAALTERMREIKRGELEDAQEF